MDLKLIVFVFGCCVVFCHGDYTCLCNYNVEIPVNTGPDITSPVIGYMYEFDCKNLLSGDDTDWPSIEFEHQMGYVKTNGQVRVQTCPGSVPDGDRIVATTSTPSSTTVRTTTVISRSKTTVSLKTSSNVKNATTSPTTRMSTSTTAKPLITEFTKLPSATFPSKLTLSSNTTTNQMTNSGLTTFLLFNNTLPPTTNLPTNTTVNSPTMFSTFPSIIHLNSSSSASTLHVLNSSFYEKSTLSSVVTGAPGQSTSPSYTVSSHMHQSTTNSSFKGTKDINTSTNSTTPSSTSTSTLLVILTTNNSLINSKLPTEITYRLSTVSKKPNFTSVSASHSLSFNNLSTATSSKSYPSNSTITSISTPYFTNQSSTHSASLLTTETEISSTKSSSTSGWTSTSSPFISTKFTESNPISSVSTSKFPDFVSTIQTGSNPSMSTSEWKTTNMPITSEPPMSSSRSSGNTGPTEKPIVSDRVDLCPYKNLAMSMYNSTTYTYPLFRQYGNYCYELRLKLGDWFEAQQDCVARGGELAVIQNEEVQARVFNLSSSTKYKVDTWIGLHDLNKEGHWEWVNGAKITKSSFNRGVLINPAFTDSQDCVLIDAKSGVWKNTACTSMLFDIQSYPWVCQYRMT